MPEQLPDRVPRELVEERDRGGHLVRRELPATDARSSASLTALPGTSTRLTQEFRAEGLIPAIAARIFALGSYKGSFRGELEAFSRIAEREAREPG